MKTKTHFEQVPLAIVKEIIGKIDGASWKEIYQEAARENDKAKLHDLVIAAESAIFLRLQELESSSNHHEERQEIEAAANGLLEIKVDRLGWPDFKA